MKRGILLGVELQCNLLPMERYPAYIFTLILVRFKSAQPACRSIS
jgi:hypothetical protein